MQDGATLAMQQWGLVNGAFVEVALDEAQTGDL